MFGQRSHENGRLCGMSRLPQRVPRRSFFTALWEAPLRHPRPPNTIVWACRARVAQSTFAPTRPRPVRSFSLFPAVSSTSPLPHPPRTYELAVFPWTRVSRAPRSQGGKVTARHRQARLTQVHMNLQHVHEMAIVHRRETEKRQRLLCRKSVEVKGGSPNASTEL